MGVLDELAKLIVRHGFSIITIELFRQLRKEEGRDPALLLYKRNLDNRASCCAE